jgi:hypothetical protein
MNAVEFDKEYKRVMMQGAKKFKEKNPQKKGEKRKEKNESYELKLVEINMQVNSLPRAYYVECVCHA